MIITDTPARYLEDALAVRGGQMDGGRQFDLLQEYCAKVTLSVSYQIFGPRQGFEWIGAFGDGREWSPPQQQQQQQQQL